MGKLDGQVVIVTGGARGIGEGICKVFCNEGATVAIWDVIDEGIKTAESIKKTGGKIFFQKVDVTNQESVNGAVEEIITDYKRIDVLINNAALYGTLKSGRFEDIDSDQWDRAMNVNVKGVWNCCRAVVPSMREQKSGSIINIASLAAIYGMPYAADYAASKAAVLGLTRVIAREVGKDGIRVNSVAPSMVKTDSAEEFLGEKAERAFDVIAKGQILQKTLEVDDIYGTILYLASDQSKFVTGQTLMVDGGSVLL